MVVGMRESTWLSALVVCVAIGGWLTSLVINSSPGFVYWSSSLGFVTRSGARDWLRTVITQEFIEPLRDALGSLSTIFTHLHECGPYPRAEESKKNKPWGLELASPVNEAVEIRELSFERVADALDAVERDAAHSGEARY